jgi:AcrR family transcriptional regulator
MKLNTHSERFRVRRHDAAAQALVEAGESAIARRGYDRVTMRDIASEAGCAPGTLYLYFKNKREMVNAIMVRHHAILYPQIVKALGSLRQDPVERLRAMSRQWVQYCFANRNLFKVIFAARPANPEEVLTGLPAPVRKEWESLRRSELEVIRQGQRQGKIRCDFEPEEIQRFIHGVTAGLLTEVSVLDPLPDAERQSRMLWGFLTGGILGARSDAISDCRLPNAECGKRKGNG